MYAAPHTPPTAMYAPQVPQAQPQVQPQAQPRRSNKARRGGLGGSGGGARVGGGFGGGFGGNGRTTGVPFGGTKRQFANALHSANVIHSANTQPLAAAAPFATVERHFTNALEAFPGRVANPMVPETALRQEFEGLLALRQQLARSAAQQVQGATRPMQDTTRQMQIPAAQIEAQREQILHMVCALLSATNEWVLPMKDIWNDPHIRVAMKGVVSSMDKFLPKFPAHFAFEDLPQEDPTKPPLKAVRLLTMPEAPAMVTPEVVVAGNGGALVGGRGAVATGGAAFGGGGVMAGKGGQQSSALPPHVIDNRRAQICYAVVEILQQSEGMLETEKKLCDDPVIAELKRGVSKRMSPILAMYPETFELVQGPPAPDGHAAAPCVRLQPGGAESLAAALPYPDALAADAPLPPPASKKRRLTQNHQLRQQQRQQLHGGAAPGSGPASEAGVDSVEAEARREQLASAIRDLVSASPEGAVRLEDIAQEPVVADLRRGVVSKLQPFLEMRPEVFQLYDAEAENGRSVKCVSIVP